MSWRILTTPPLSGADNMRQDAEALSCVELGESQPTLRFFRFKDPTLSFGRLQRREDITPLIPHGWAFVQRPTGGGIVFHKDDLCFSLCWKDGQAPLPNKPQDQYRWIHSVVLEALSTEFPARMAIPPASSRRMTSLPGEQGRMAVCGDVGTSPEPFSIRTCFQNPVGYDLLREQQKIVGGALRCTRRATLYQGSLEIPDAQALEPRLRAAFQKALS